MVLLGNSVLIKPDRLPERTSSGALLIPANSKEMLPEWGTAVDVGPACKEVKIGDHTIFPRKSASLITIDNEDFYFTNEQRILFMRSKQ